MVLAWAGVPHLACAGAPHLARAVVPHLACAGVPHLAWAGVPHLACGGVPNLACAGVPHLFWKFDNTTTLKCKITPPSNAEQFFLTYAGLAQDHGSLDKSNSMQIVVSFVGGHLVLSDFRMVSEWFVIKHVLVPVVRFFYILQAFQPEYTG